MVKRTLDNKLFILIMLFLLSSCAVYSTIPPGQLTENDYLWEEKTFNADYNAVYRNILGGFRTCAGKDGGVVFADQIGAPNCIVNDDTREITCDIYFNEGIRGRTTIVFGIIKIKEINDGKTLVRYGQYTRYPLTRPVKHWKNFSEGVYSCEVKE